MMTLLSTQTLDELQPKNVSEAIDFIHSIVNTLMRGSVNDLRSKSQRFDDIQRTHTLTVILEILQNINDARTKLERSDVLFSFSGDILQIHYDGDPFGPSNIQGFWSEWSDKRGEAAKTGEKGMGFKSLFHYSDRIIIKSGDKDVFGFSKTLFNEKYTALQDDDFASLWMGVPLKLEREKFILKQDLPKRSMCVELKLKEKARNQLLSLLDNLKKEDILFFQKISNIQISLEGKLLSALDNDQRNLKQICFTGVLPEIGIEIPKGKYRLPEARQGSILIPDEVGLPGSMPFYNTYRIKGLYLDLPCFINAKFILNSNRELFDMAGDQTNGFQYNWNKGLLESAAQALVSHLLTDPLQHKERIDGICSLKLEGRTSSDPKDIFITKLKRCFAEAGNVFESSITGNNISAEEGLIDETGIIAKLNHRQLKLKVDIHQANLSKTIKKIRKFADLPGESITSKNIQDYIPRDAVCTDTQLSAVLEAGLHKELYFLFVEGPEIDLSKKMIFCDQSLRPQIKLIQDQQLGLSLYTFRDHLTQMPNILDEFWGKFNRSLVIKNEDELILEVCRSAKSGKEKYLFNYYRTRSLASAQHVVLQTLQQEILSRLMSPLPDHKELFEYLSKDEFKLYKLDTFEQARKKIFNLLKVPASATKLISPAHDFCIPKQYKEVDVTYFLGKERNLYTESDLPSKTQEYLKLSDFRGEEHFHNLIHKRFSDLLRKCDGEELISLTNIYAKHFLDCAKKKSFGTFMSGESVVDAEGSKTPLPLITLPFSPMFHNLTLNRAYSEVVRELLEPEMGTSLAGYLNRCDEFNHHYRIQALLQDIDEKNSWTDFWTELLNAPVTSQVQSKILDILVNRRYKCLTVEIDGRKEYRALLQNDNPILKSNEVLLPREKSGALCEFLHLRTLNSEVQFIKNILLKEHALTVKEEYQQVIKNFGLITDSSELANNPDILVPTSSKGNYRRLKDLYVFDHSSTKKNLQYTFDDEKIIVVPHETNTSFNGFLALAISTHLKRNPERFINAKDCIFKVMNMGQSYRLEVEGIPFEVSCTKAYDPQVIMLYNNEQFSVGLSKKQFTWINEGVYSFCFDKLYIQSNKFPAAQFISLSLGLDCPLRIERELERLFESPTPSTEKLNNVIPKEGKAISDFNEPYLDLEQDRFKGPYKGLITFDYEENSNSRLLLCSDHEKYLLEKLDTWGRCKGLKGELSICSGWAGRHHQLGKSGLFQRLLDKMITILNNNPDFTINLFFEYNSYNGVITSKEGELLRPYIYKKNLHVFNRPQLHCKVLLFESPQPENNFAVVGSHNWLSNTGENSVEISIEFTNGITSTNKKTFENLKLFLEDLKDNCQHETGIKRIVR